MIGHELKNEIRRFLAGECSSRELEKWIVARLHQIFASGLAGDINLAVQVDALLVELGEELVSKQEVEESIRSLLEAEERTIYLSLPELPAEQNQPRSSADTLVRELADPVIQRRNETIRIDFTPAQVA